MPVKTIVYRLVLDTTRFVIETQNAVRLMDKMSKKGIADVQKLGNKIQTVQNQILGLGKSITAVFTQAKYAMQGFTQGMYGLQQAIAGTTSAMQHLYRAAKGTTTMFTAAQRSARSAMNLFSSVLFLPLRIVKAVFSGIKGIFSLLGSIVKGAINIVIGLVSSTVRAITGMVKGVFNAITGIGKFAISSVIAAFKGFFSLSKSIFTGITNAVMGVWGALMRLKTVLGVSLVGVLTIATKKAVEFETAMRAIELLSRNVGASGQAFKGLINRGVGGMFSKLETAEGIKTALALGATQEEIMKLAGPLRNAAALFGEDLSTAFTAVMRAAVHGEPELAERIGLQLREFAVMKESMALYGKRLRDLDAEQKRIVVLSSALRQLNKFRGAENTVMTSALGIWRRLKAATSDFLVSFGMGFKRAMNEFRFLDRLSEWMASFSEDQGPFAQANSWVKKVSKEMSSNLEMLNSTYKRSVFGEGTSKASSTGERVGSIIVKFANKAFEFLKKAMSWLKENWPFLKRALVEVGTGMLEVFMAAVRFFATHWRTLLTLLTTTVKLVLRVWTELIYGLNRAMTYQREGGFFDYLGAVLRWMAAYGIQTLQKMGFTVQGLVPTLSGLGMVLIWLAAVAFKGFFDAMYALYDFQNTWNKLMDKKTWEGIGQSEGWKKTKAQFQEGGWIRTNIIDPTITFIETRVVELFKKVRDYLLRAFWDMMEDLRLRIDEFLYPYNTSLQQIWDKIWSVIPKNSQELQFYIDKLKEFGNTLLSIYDGVKNVITAFSDSVRSISGAYTNVSNLFGGGAFGFIPGIIAALLTAVYKAIVLPLEVFGISGILLSLVTAATLLNLAWKTSTTLIVSGAIGFVKGIMTALKGLLLAVASGIGMAGGTGAIMASLSSVVAAVWAALTTPLGIGLMMTAAVFIMDKLFPSLFKGISDTLYSWWDSVKSFFGFKRTGLSPEEQRKIDADYERAKSDLEAARIGAGLDPESFKNPAMSSEYSRITEEERKAKEEAAAATEQYNTAISNLNNSLKNSVDVFDKVSSQVNFSVETSKNSLGLKAQTVYYPGFGVPAPQMSSVPATYQTPGYSSSNVRKGFNMRRSMGMFPFMSGADFDKAQLLNSLAIASTQGRIGAYLSNVADMRPSEPAGPFGPGLKVINVNNANFGYTPDAVRRSTQEEDRAGATR